MIFPVLGLIIVFTFVAGLIALDEVVKWRRGGHRPARWHWFVLSVVGVAAISLITLWIGEYRFESGQCQQRQTDLITAVSGESGYRKRDLARPTC